jgi:hypothetical protein
MCTELQSENAEGRDHFGDLCRREDNTEMELEEIGC